MAHRMSIDSNEVSAMEGLQRTVESQQHLIDQLTSQNTQLKNELQKLKEQISKNTSSSSSSSSSNSNSGSGGGGNGGGGVDSGVSHNAAANMLAAKLGGLVKKPMAGGGGGNSSSSGGGSGGGSNPVSTNIDVTGGEDEPLTAGTARGGPDYDRIFKKYEMMLKLGISIHGAMGRMTQDGIDKDIVKAFKAKHAGQMEDQQEEEVNLQELGLQPKRNITTEMKLKKMHWEPVHPTLIPQTVWKEIDDSTIKYNAKHFELNFQIRGRKPMTQNKSSGGKNDKDSNERKEFVPTKRSQQVQIGYKGLGITRMEDLRAVLLNMDEAQMDQEKLMKLMDIVPTQDEQNEAEKQISANGGDPTAFGVSEQLFYALSDFYDLEKRLKMWLFKMQFQEITSTLMTQFKVITKTCDKLKNNKGLRTLFAILLAFGNHMNAGTKKGQAYGFDLKVLTQLGDIKTFDNSKNFIMYVYEFCDRNYPDVLKIGEELSALLKKSGAIESEVLHMAYDRVVESMKEIQELVEGEEKEMYDTSDRFLSTMTSFYKTAKSSLSKLTMNLNNLDTRRKRTMKQFAFGDDDKPEKIEHLFKILWEFLESVERAKEKLVNLEKERQKKKQKKEKLKQSGKKPEKSGQHKTALEAAVEAKLAFEESLKEAKGKLTTHVRERSIFVRSGGQLDDRRSSDATLRRISSMYQDNLEEVRKIEEAKRKAALNQYNKFVLKPLPNTYQLGKTRFNDPKNAQPKMINLKGDEQLPDDVPFSAPPAARIGNGPSSGSAAATNASQPTSDTRVRHDTGIADARTMAMEANSNGAASSSNDERHSHPSMRNITNQPSTTSMIKQKEKEKEKEKEKDNHKDDEKEKSEKDRYEKRNSARTPKQGPLPDKEKPLPPFLDKEKPLPPPPSHDSDPNDLLDKKRSVKDLRAPHTMSTIGTTPPQYALPSRNPLSQSQQILTATSPQVHSYTSQTQLSGHSSTGSGGIAIPNAKNNNSNNNNNTGTIKQAQSLEHRYARPGNKQ